MLKKALISELNKISKRSFGNEYKQNLNLKTLEWLTRELSNLKALYPSNEAISNRIIIFKTPILRNYHIAVVKENVLVCIADNMQVIGDLLKIWNCKLSYTGKIYIEPIINDDWKCDMTLSGDYKNWLIKQKETTK